MRYTAQVKFNFTAVKINALTLLRANDFFPVYILPAMTPQAVYYFSLRLAGQLRFSKITLRSLSEKS
jgi:hypothetical protein